MVIVCLSPFGLLKTTVYSCPSTPFGIFKVNLEGIVETTSPSIIIELVSTDNVNFLLGHEEGNPLPRIGIFPPSVENSKVLSVIAESTSKTKALL